MNPKKEKKLIEKIVVRKSMSTEEVFDITGTAISGIVSIGKSSFFINNGLSENIYCSPDLIKMAKKLEKANNEVIKIRKEIFDLICKK